MKTLIWSFLILALSGVLGRAESLEPEASLPVPLMPEAPTAPSGPLPDFFTADALPGAGILTLQSGEKTEKIELGNASGHYAMGMQFQGSALPGLYGQTYKKEILVQLSFGSLNAKYPDKLSQFGALTLILEKAPTHRTLYQLILPSGKDEMLVDLGFLMFASPETPRERAPEEKLKGWYFAQSGTLTFNPIQTQERVEIKSQGKKLEFYRTTAKVDLSAALVTPFNSQPTTLTGSFEIPIFRPAGKEAVNLAKRSLAESLETTTQIALSRRPATEAREPSPPPKRKPRLSPKNQD